MSEETPTPFDPAAFSDADLMAEHERVRTRGGELASKSEHTEAEAAEFADLADKLGPLTTEIERRTQAAADAQAKRDAFASAPAASIPSIRPIEAPQTAAVEPTSVQMSTETQAVPSVAQMAAQNPAPVQHATVAEARRSVTAHALPHAAGLLHKQVDAEFSGLREISETILRTASMKTQGRTGIAQFRRNRDEANVVPAKANGDETMGIIRRARNEFSLDGGNLARMWQKGVDNGSISLTAAAGWCAPSQNDYDLCTNWASGVGLLDLPTVTATRGGINYTDEPDFPTIYANAIAVGGGSNLLTEAEVIADTAKTCSEIPCPTFEDRRLDVAALCIRASFLQAAGYPEVVNAWMDGLMAAHEQEINRNIIAQILTRAGAATTFDSPGIGQDSFTSAVLAAVELAQVDLTYRFMLPANSTIEVVFPMWVLAQMRADLSRRTGDTGALLGYSDSQIASLFSVRNVRPQFVRGWQDGLITGGALDGTMPGGDAATPFLTALPSTVSFLAWPAGSVVLARQDVVTLTNVYDAASLAQNEYTALFTEEGYAPLFPCPGQRLYTVTGCVGGVTGEALINCNTV